MRLRPGIWQVLWFTHPLKITFLSAHIMATVKIRIIYLFSHHGQPEIIVSDRDPRFLDTLSGLNYSAIRHTVVYVYGRDGCRVFEDVFHSYASLISHIIKFGSFIDRICNTMLYIREPVWRPFLRTSRGILALRWFLLSQLQNTVFEIWWRSMLWRHCADTLVIASDAHTIAEISACAVNFEAKSILRLDAMHHIASPIAIFFLKSILPL